MDFNSLPNKKSLHLPKLKACADTILNFTQNIELSFIE